MHICGPAVYWSEAGNVLTGIRIWGHDLNDEETGARVDSGLSYKGQERRADVLLEKNYGA